MAESTKPHSSTPQDEDNKVLMGMVNSSFLKESHPSNSDNNDNKKVEVGILRNRNVCAPDARANFVAFMARKGITAEDAWFVMKINDRDLDKRAYLYLSDEIKTSVFLNNLSESDKDRKTLPIDGVEDGNDGRIWKFTFENNKRCAYLRQEWRQFARALNLKAGDEIRLRWDPQIPGVRIRGPQADVNDGVTGVVAKADVHHGGIKSDAAEVILADVDGQLDGTHHDGSHAVVVVADADAQNDGIQHDQHDGANADQDQEEEQA